VPHLKSNRRSNQCQYRNVESGGGGFKKKTTTTWRENLAHSPGSVWHAIAVPSFMKFRHCGYRNACTRVVTIQRRGAHVSTAKYSTYSAHITVNHHLILIYARLIIVLKFTKNLSPPKVRQHDHNFSPASHPLTRYVIIITIIYRPG